MQNHRERLKDLISIGFFANTPPHGHRLGHSDGMLVTAHRRLRREHLPVIVRAFKVTAVPIRRESPVCRPREVPECGDNRIMQPAAH